MTQQDLIVKWSHYGAVTLLLFFLERCVFSRLPIAGVVPMLIPLAVVMVAAFEGSSAGAVFGLVTGAVCVISFAGTSPWLILAFTCIGLLCGITTQYAISPSLSGCLFCAALTLTLTDLLRIFSLALFRNASLLPLLKIAVPEILYSLVLALPVYLLFSRVYQKVGGNRLM